MASCSAPALPTFSRGLVDADAGPAGDSGVSSVDPSVTTWTFAQAPAA